MATKLWTKAPESVPPQCATRSISRNPGGGAFQSANVRTGTCRLALFLLTRRLPDGLEEPVYGRRAGRNETLADVGIEV